MGRGLRVACCLFGVLIKALLKSGKKKLQETSFEILRSLPDLNINPGIELYNQFLEHFAVSHDYRQAQNVMKLMSGKPKIAPDLRYTSTNSTLVGHRVILYRVYRAIFICNHLKCE